MLKRKSSLNFADVAVAKRKIKNQFLIKIDQLIDWKLIEDRINKKYSRGNRFDGRPAYPGLILFKMCLLEEWFNIYHNKIDFYVNDSISFTHFLGLSLDDEVPSHSTVSRFRIELHKKGLYSQLLEQVNQQIDSKNLRVRSGILKQAVILHNK
ncbi:MAG: transposase [Bacteroidetes bacterium]|nr:transposase [Bacteroidota bacterium]